MQRINSVTVTFEQIIRESKIPWERHLMPNKVLYVPYKGIEQDIKSKRRKSQKRRDAEKKRLFRKQNHGGSCPGWPTGGKGYAYGWRSSIEMLGQRFKIHKRNSESFVERKKGLNKDQTGKIRELQKQ